jgi:hypothetical protein
MGGGGNSYAGYTIPTKLKTNENASYTISTQGSATGISFMGTSIQNASYTGQVSIGTDGRSLPTGGWSYNGDFQ